ncbi:protein-glutamine gamma-glutamyltransferase TgpA [Desulfosarcina cetonica]|uniref:transglutaminase TgpA family protein n=1 Tax=Desulfosarcina cetonica TaxID=90730 RepID=UPI0006D0EBBF|nr:DUF3488 and transglutaminase-like domain-containing protein [Desulfosarcina cetonica]
MLRQPIRPLIVALAVAAAPLALHLPAWAIGWCILCWTYCLAADRRGWPGLPPWVRFAGFAVGMLGVLVSAGLRFDGGDFIVLLAVMAGMKPLEVRSRRDSMVTVFLAYFLVITSLFVFENLSMTIYLFLSVWVTTGVLVRVNHPAGATAAQLRLAARLVGTAIPLMVLLFLLFPRLPGSFWSSPWNRQGVSGFSSTIRMGDVSRLALTDAPAFAVTFDAAPPRPEKLYWRGIVFRDFDGQTWYPERHRHPRRPLIGGTTRSAYTVVMEPTGQRHLFALDLPQTADPVAVIGDDYTLETRRPVRQRLRYRAVSWVDARQDATPFPDPRYRQLPEGRNPRALALGREWAQSIKTPETIVTAALDFFRTSGFVYSLQPGPLGADAVDDFLFMGRKGFCEHFAVAFTVLLRAAGVPTRLVGGYQGGQWNAMGEFLSVRQSDAHVWCEAWLPGKGWTRVDPTAVVAPERIAAGGTRDDPAGLSQGVGVRLIRRWQTLARETWEAVNIRWNMWFMGFSAEDQVALLKRLGVVVGRQTRWLVVGVLPVLFVIVLALVSRIRNRPVKPTGDVPLRTYYRFLVKMRHAGLPKAPHEGPLAYAGKVGRRAPALKPAVDGIIAGYVALRYSRDGRKALLKDFRREVRHFHPRRLLAKSRQKVEPVD